MDDIGLLERARLGDEEAFSQLFARYQRPIFRYAAYVCGPDAGDDIVQETFLAVLRQRGRGDAPASGVLAYLLGIARHRVLKRLAARQETGLEVPFDADLPHGNASVGAATSTESGSGSGSASTLRGSSAMTVTGTAQAVAQQQTVLDALTHAETIEAVRAAVHSLPPQYREVVALCELQEMDYAEAAAVIQCPIGTVRSRLHRARGLLETKLAATHSVAGARGR